MTDTMRCKHCRLAIRANDGEARPDFPWVHDDGFIRCDTRIVREVATAYPESLEAN